MKYCLVSPFADVPLEYFDEEEYRLFRLADGKTDIDLKNDLTDRQQIAYILHLDKGILCECEQPSPIEDIQKYICYPNVYICSVYWSITGDCNLRCRHCYMSGGRNKYRELSKEKLYHLIHQFDECGVMNVELSGGEPYSSPYFWEIVDEIKRRNMYINYLHTNGLLLDDEFYEQAKIRQMKWMIDLSYDGVGTHDYLRATEGVEALTVAAIRKVKEKGYPLKITSKFHMGSIHTIMDTYRFVKEVEADSWKVSMVFPIGEATSHIKTTPAILNQEYLDMLQQYKEDDNPFNLNLLEGAVKGFKGGEFKFWENEYGDDGLKKCLSCAKVRKAPYVLPDGTLLPCIGFSTGYQEQFMPNLLETSLREVYCNKDSAFRKLTDIKSWDVIEHNEECKACEFREQCGGGCRADASGTHPDVDASYLRGMMMCSAYKSGFMTKAREIAKKH